MRNTRGTFRAGAAGLVALLALSLQSGLVIGAGNQTRTSGGLVAAVTTTDDAEHDEDTSPTIRIKWLLPASAGPVHIAAPSLRLELTGVGVAGPLDVQVRALEDAGTLQSRRVGQPVRDTLFGSSRLELPVRFGEKLPASMTHSGMVVAVVRACPIGGAYVSAEEPTGECLTGTSDPLFFHGDGAGFLVYGEKALCQFFRCGALSGGETSTPGTWRVMGGGPLQSAPSREEPTTADDDRLVNGGDR